MEFAATHAGGCVGGTGREAAAWRNWAGPASSHGRGEFATFVVVASGRTLAIQWYRMPKDRTEVTMIEGPRCLVLMETTLAR